VSTYLLDTGLLLGHIRGADYADLAERRYSLSQPPNVSLVSVVTKGEIYSLAIQFNWGERKKQELDSLLRRIPVVDINTDRIIQRYAEVDAYSQGKDRTNRFQGACLHGIWARTIYGLRLLLPCSTQQS
jgi:tRNA(fMet)-specific endonuclease VapC